MRLLLGLVLGALLTIGTAYVHDTAPARSVPSATTSETRPIVNWDVVHTNLRSLRAWMVTEWHRLTAG